MGSRAIANLEIGTTDLLVAKAELEWQQEEEKLKLEDKVLHLLLDYLRCHTCHTPRPKFLRF